MHSSGCKKRLPIFAAALGPRGPPLWRSDVENIILRGSFDSFNLRLPLPRFHKLKSLTYIVTVPYHVLSNPNLRPKAQHVSSEVLSRVSRTLETIVVQGKPNPCLGSDYYTAYAVTPHNLDFPNLKAFELGGAIRCKWKGSVFNIVPVPLPPERA
jgi:hypothetical protein